MFANLMQHYKAEKKRLRDNGIVDETVPVTESDTNKMISVQADKVVEDILVHNLNKNKKFMR